MSCKLEDYLKNERDRLDVESPDDRVIWERIESRLSENVKENRLKNTRVTWIRIRNIAAVAIIMFCVGYITKDIINTNSSTRTVTLSSIDSRLGQREDQYRTMVSLRTREVKTLGSTDNTVVRELFGELSNLDTIYMQSVTDLRVLGPNDKVINTIFDTYEQKIRLLELIILETNKTKIHENNEKISL